MDNLIPERFSDEMLLRNEFIKAAYHNITEKIIALSKNFSIPELRTRIEIKHNPELDPDFRVHELFTPYIYLSLSIQINGSYLISFARDFQANSYLGQQDFIQLSQIIYEETTSKKPSINTNHSLIEYSFDIEKYNRLHFAITNNQLNNAELTIEEATI